MHLPLKSHRIGAQNLLTGDDRRVLHGERLPGVVIFLLSGNGGQCLSDADAVGAAVDMPGEFAVTELFAAGEGLGRPQRFFLIPEEAAVVVLLRRAAALDADAGEGDGQQARLEPGRLAVYRKRGVVPVADVQPAPLPFRFYICIELHPGGLSVPDLRVDPQNRPQGPEALRKSARSRSCSTP